MPPKVTSASEQTSLTILGTRLYPHRLGPNLIQRNRLLERMELSSELPLTLVVAPAGYGKSILVSQWSERHEGHVAWLSLGEDNSNIRSFLGYFVAALELVSRRICPLTKKSLLAPKLPTVSELAWNLINDLDCLDTPCTLILDDYHLIDARSPVHELIDLLLEYPPRFFHLMIVTRRDPPLKLTKLQADNRGIVLRLLDLRFTRSETREFLGLATGLAIENLATERLETELEGWAVGLQLAALVACRSPDPMDFLLNLEGGSVATREYLRQEVFNAQSPAMRSGLLVSAIFTRFCARALDAVWVSCIDQSDEAISATEFLKNLQRQNLFLIPLDDESEWVRFHHLFREILNRELSRSTSLEQIRCFHRSASEWFETEGLIEEALEHALEAEDIQHATQIVRKRAGKLINEGKWYLLEKWLDLLPLSTKSAEPILQLSEAFIHYRNMNLAAVPPLLDRIDELMGGQGKKHELTGEVSAFRAYYALLENDSAKALQFLDHGDCASMTPPHHPTRALTEILYALAGHTAGQGDQVKRELGLVLKDNSLRLEPMREANLAQIQAFLSYISADSKGVGPMLRRARTIAEPADLKHMIPWSEYLDGLFSLQQGRLKSAITLLEKAAEYKYFHHVLGAVNGMCALAVCYQFLGLSKQAENTLHSLERFVIGQQPPLDVFVDSCAARLSILRGEGAAATYWIENDESPQKEMMFFWFEIPGITRCRALVENGSVESLSEAATVLEEYVKECESQHNICHLIEVLSLLALTYAHQGKTEQARFVLERSLALARPGRFFFAFLEPGQGMIELLEKVDGEHEDFAKYILMMFSNLVAPEPPEKLAEHQSEALEATARQTQDQILAEPLTKREQDVLELLVKRLQDKEIAIELGIAPSTVKGHMKQIFDKLQIHDRRHAARQAARYGYLS